jgi:hypothetical protein
MRPELNVASSDTIHSTRRGNASIDALPTQRKARKGIKDALTQDFVGKCIPDAFTSRYNFPDAFHILLGTLLSGLYSRWILLVYK